MLVITSLFVHQVSMKSLDIMDSQIKTVENKLANEGITGVDKYLKELFKDEKNNKLTYVAIKELPKDFDISKSNEVFPGEIKYSYPEKMKNEYYSNRFGHEVVSNNIGYFLETGVKTFANSDNSGMYRVLGILTFAVCWVLWIIWSIINVHGYGYLNIKWCILLISIGILGYFIFSLLVNPKNIINNRRNNIRYISISCFIVIALMSSYILNNPYRIQRLHQLIFH